jgi:hypothetical protein
MTRCWIALFGIVCATGCLRTTQYRCATDTECGGGGTCESVGYCSFTDSSCADGRRFGDLSGPYANTCVGGGGGDDAGIDAPIDTPDAPPGPACFGGTGAYQLCFDPAPAGSLTLSGTLDTATDARCGAIPAPWTTAGQANACIVARGGITITGTLNVIGTRPLVLVAGSISVSGTLDAASHLGGTTGPAAPASQCAAFATAPTANGTGGGGGAGASFTSRGGNGGLGDAATAGGGAANADATTPVLLRAGCTGQTGGASGVAAGAPGRGGGAVYLAANNIVIAGTINVSGSGAAASTMQAGGSGGGSGGTVVLRAMTIMMSGRVVANGGGGASGTSNAAGNAGNDPVPTQPTTPAAGGVAVGGGGAGGAGAAGVNPAAAGGDATMPNRSGGAGGGGAGYIELSIAATGGGTFSPTPTIK